MNSTISKGSIVTLQYTLKDSAGEIIDRSTPDEPFDYLHGANNIVPGLERQLEGRKVGDKIKAVVKPEEGYGKREGPEPQRVPRDQMPDDLDIQEGMQLHAEGPEGELVALWVTAVEKDHILVDLNHPLAGETLHFDVEVMGLRQATEEELNHGHPHGPNGHHH